MKLLLGLRPRVRTCEDLCEDLCEEDLCEEDLCEEDLCEDLCDICRSSNMPTMRILAKFNSLGVMCVRCVKTQ